MVKKPTLTLKEIIAKKGELRLEELSTDIQIFFMLSAIAKIEIGELLNKHQEYINEVSIDAYLKGIGLDNKTAQRYIDFASDPRIKKNKDRYQLHLDTCPEAEYRYLFDRVSELEKDLDSYKYKSA